MTDVELLPPVTVECGDGKVVFYATPDHSGSQTCGPDPRSSLYPVQTTPECQEDEPCWDCTTMGNMICGPITPITATTVVAVPPRPVDTLPVTGMDAVSLGLYAGLAVLFGVMFTRVKKH
jgi:hypothetical protein